MERHCEHLLTCVLPFEQPAFLCAVPQPPCIQGVMQEAMAVRKPLVDRPSTILRAMYGGC